MSNEIKTVAMLWLAVLGQPVTAAAGSPHGPCTNLPRFGWVSFDEIKASLKQSGYRLLHLRITSEACYAALVTNAAGQRLELLIHPGTSKVIAPEELPTSAIRR
ncbi:MAG: PepSY domain-containing protein [Methylobacterium sp.]|nr:PepSY domain-containing protein [Methylobacterium sp.]MCA3657693.1 PepSY domain-containing protein [Methylobacterium sp.]MCA3661888.1 PepSY domain-containing protein [Methylobacterium sp.]MCA3664338.1 PepSY domain-containing protein [Methylobacterium sp.]MCA3667312.1 PepSY domain-containing protein [Methylobacterium sp.]